MFMRMPKTSIENSIMMKNHPNQHEQRDAVHFYWIDMTGGGIAAF